MRRSFPSGNLLECGRHTRFLWIEYNVIFHMRWTRSGIAANQGACLSSNFRCNFLSWDHGYIKQRPFARLFTLVTSSFTKHTRSACNSQSSSSLSQQQHPLNYQNVPRSAAQRDATPLLSHVSWHHAQEWNKLKPSRSLPPSVPETQHHSRDKPQSTSESMSL